MLQALNYPSSDYTTSFLSSISKAIPSVCAQGKKKERKKSGDMMVCLPLVIIKKKKKHIIRNQLQFNRTKILLP